MFLISFARRNTALLLTDLTFSPHFLTYKIQFSMLVSPFFSISCRLFACSSYSFLVGLSPVGSGVLHEFFLFPEMQTQLYIFDFKNLLCSQDSMFHHSSETKKSQAQEGRTAQGFYLSVQKGLWSAWSGLFSTLTSSTTSSLCLN